MRALITLLVSVVALCASAGAGLAADKVDPIDAAMTQCLNDPATQSNADMLRCLDTAYHAWDKALNVAYGRLVKRLDHGSAVLLRASERKWIAYRDAEIKFAASLQTPEAGTDMELFATQGLVDLVKGRVMVLRDYLP